jgi:hypothetical protein
MQVSAGDAAVRTRGRILRPHGWQPITRELNGGKGTADDDPELDDYELRAELSLDAVQRRVAIVRAGDNGASARETTMSIPTTTSRSFRPCVRSLRRSGTPTGGHSQGRAGGDQGPSSRYHQPRAAAGWWCLEAGGTSMRGRGR